MRLLDWHLNSSAPVRPSQAIAMMGHIPEFIFADDPRPAHEQIAERYIGGWSPCGPNFGWSMTADFALLYPGDPPMQPVAGADHGDEMILIYPHAWVVILQSDKSFSVARLD